MDGPFRYKGKHFKKVLPQELLSNLYSISKSVVSTEMYTVNDKHALKAFSIDNFASAKKMLVLFFFNFSRLLSIMQ